MCYNNAQSSYDNEILFSKLYSEVITNKQCKDLRNEVRYLIGHYLHMTELADAEMRAMHRFNILYITLAIALLSYLSNNSNNIPLAYVKSGKVLVIVTMITSVVNVIVYYFYRTYKYPFVHDETISNAEANQAYWFYRGNKSLSTLRIRILPRKKEELEAYRRGMVEYASSVLDSSCHLKLARDIKYAYLLYVHNMYKNKFMNNIHTVTKYGVIIAIALYIFSIIIINI